MEELDAATELLQKYGNQLGLNGKGWGGCTCACHREPSLAVHITPCCYPSKEEKDRMMRLFKEDPVAQELLSRMLIELLGSSGLSGVSLARVLGSFGRR